ncbi:TetR/AcrR family transcriptional regulator [Flagellimonas marina]|uniref:TetR family transcriptional regulator C-terminal domain-containing protein n=1 Tax=Flagellimonas marina TaxID=1775168 RepID=A0ABV8PJ75_9FLAO
MKEETKDKILDIGVDLIAKKGYNGIGIQEVLDRAQVPKGSFYHYFKNKEDFGLQVIKKHGFKSLQYIDSFLSNTSLAPLQRIFALFEDIQRVYEEKEFKEGCLLGNCSSELADQKECFSSTLENEFLKMENRFVVCLEEAKGNGELRADESPEELASFIVNSWEGAILRTKSTKSNEPMKTLVKFLRMHILI